MTTYVFTVVLDRRPTDDELDALHAAGCDAMFGQERALQRPTSIARHRPWLMRSPRQYCRSSRWGCVFSACSTPTWFPPPVNPDREGTVFFRWSEVAPWVRTHLGIDVPDVDPTLVVANLVLQARQHRDRVVHLSALSKLLAA